jgi:prophage antirepressor-like protein
MNNILTINNVRAYIDEKGTAQLNLEDCARGLGFCQMAASGNEVVRWERVNKYLNNFGFILSEQSIPKSGYGVFIPENIFYRLAMKANNKAAIDFQLLVCDEILPTIRKTGSYFLPQMTQQEILIATLKEQQKIAIRVDSQDVAIKTISNKLENQMTIDHASCRKIQKEIALRVYTRLLENGFHQFNEYVVCDENYVKEKRKYFSGLHREIKDRFAVSSYTDVKQKDFDSCINYIRNWVEKQ